MMTTYSGFFSGKVQIVSSAISELPRNLKGLRFLSLHPTDVQCVTVSHFGDDKLALGCSDTLRIFNKRTAEQSSVLKLRNTMVTVYNGELFISYRDGESLTIARYDSSGIENLFQFVMTLNVACHIAVNKHDIVVTDRDNNTIKVYDRTTRVLTTKKVSGLRVMFNVEFSPYDSSLLVAGEERSGEYSLTKVDISENKKLHRMWTVSLEAMAVSIALTERGMTFVSGRKNKRIYVISNQGKLKNIIPPKAMVLI